MVFEGEFKKGKGKENIRTEIDYFTKKIKIFEGEYKYEKKTEKEKNIVIIMKGMILLIIMILG